MAIFSRLTFCISLKVRSSCTLFHNAAQPSLQHPSHVHRVLETKCPHVIKASTFANASISREHHPRRAETPKTSWGVAAAMGTRGVASIATTLIPVWINRLRTSLKEQSRGDTKKYDQANLLDYLSFSLFLFKMGVSENNTIVLGYQ